MGDAKASLSGDSGTSGTTEVPNTVLVVGCTGHGKSSICCWMANTIQTDTFKVSDGKDAGTVDVMDMDVRFLGGERGPENVADTTDLRLRLIDVPGLGVVANGSGDDSILFTMKNYVENHCQNGIKAVLWVESSASPRLYQSKAKMMQNYLRWLGIHALDNLVVVFNKAPWNSQDHIERVSCSADQQLQKLAQAFKEGMKEIMRQEFTGLAGETLRRLDEKIELLPCCDLNLMPIDRLKEENVSSPMSFIKTNDLFGSRNFKSLLKLASHIKTNTILPTNHLTLNTSVKASIILRRYGRESPSRNMYVKEPLPVFKESIEREFGIRDSNYRIQFEEQTAELSVINDDDLKFMISYFRRNPDSARIITLVDVKTCEVSACISLIRFGNQKCGKTMTVKAPFSVLSETIKSEFEIEKDNCRIQYCRDRETMLVTNDDNLNSMINYFHEIDDNARKITIVDKRTCEVRARLWHGNEDPGRTFEVQAPFVTFSEAIKGELGIQNASCQIQYQYEEIITATVTNDVELNGMISYFHQIDENSRNIHVVGTLSCPAEHHDHLEGNEPKSKLDGSNSIDIINNNGSNVMRQERRKQEEEQQRQKHKEEQMQMLVQKKEEQEQRWLRKEQKRKEQEEQQRQD